jgi:serine/threonine protein kinase
MLLVLDHETFKRVLEHDVGDIQAKCARHLERQEKVDYSFDRLEEIGLLGTGSFATVTLVRDKDSGHTFALKAVGKGLVASTGNIQSVKREKLVLQTTRSPFLIRMATTFCTDQSLYFLLEPCLGGDIFTVYRRHNFFGSEVHARFYSACAIRGLAHLHERHILYRDLKMENMVMDSRGYCKLADFGLSKFLVGHAYSLCGTPEIMAPEVVAGSGHTCAADWWSCGVVLYECMVGVSPFGSSDIITIFHKIQGGIEHVESWPQKEDATWPDLVMELCCYEPSERLPMRKGGVNNVLAHCFFETFDWPEHEQCSMQAPHNPGLSGPEDLRNFDALWNERPHQITYHDHDGSLWHEGFGEARGRRIY